MDFSVIVPTFNSSLFVTQALASIRLATNSDQFEIIVVDDCSADVSELASALRSYPEARLVHKAKRSNAAESRNMGFEQSRANYVFFLDSDDEFLPGSIDRRINLHRQSGAGLIFGNYVLNQGEPEILIELPSYSSEDMRDYLFSNFGDFRSSTLSISKSEFGGSSFDPLSFKHQDWTFGIRCGDAGEKIEFDKEPVAIINAVHEARMSNRANVDASWYFCSNYLERQSQINAFSRKHWMSTLLNGDSRAAEFFCRIYKAQSAREQFGRAIYRVLGSSLLIRITRLLTIGAWRLKRLLWAIR
jgi:glycosyltransferase involved in cell wall biosynthesis